MNKQAYTAPQVKCYRIAYQEQLMAGSASRAAWTPGDGNDPNPQPPIDIKDETGGNLGDENSEISGAKGNTSFGSWDD